ncbi:hypothetical protein LEP1GSC170_3479 [Leptospira interrogans serovar Bataviae str. HAI135]|nr:hypothetical protein LEP1GSC170_3479 [Leptospira interrogans serovar Bataviae str. HAI135]
MSSHPKRGKTKAERFPELSVSLLGSLDRLRSKAHKFYRGFVVIPTNLYRDLNVCGVGYAKIAITTSL